MALNATAIGISWNIYVLNVWYNRYRKIFLFKQTYASTTGSERFSYREVSRL